jgi:hypothetical protein
MLSPNIIIFADSHSTEACLHDDITMIAFRAVYEV